MDASKRLELWSMKERRTSFNCVQVTSRHVPPTARDRSKSYGELNGRGTVRGDRSARRQRSTTSIKVAASASHRSLNGDDKKRTIDQLASIHPQRSVGRSYTAPNDPHTQLAVNSHWPMIDFTTQHIVESERVQRTPNAVDVPRDPVIQSCR